jgi:FRG domain
MSDNFNYIAFGNWEWVGRHGGRIEMGRGRMFEYTPSDIERRLEALEPPSIDFLEKLPTFLCSEFSSSSTSMLVKFGRIENTHTEKKEVVTTFTTLIDFGEVVFRDLDHARTVFRADGMQLHRTHWAVRDGDVGQILTSLAQIKPDLENQVQQQLAPHVATAPTEPPPRIKNSIGSADSVEVFLGRLYEFTKIGSTENFFRGHEDSRFELTPSLLRKLPEGAWQYLPNEDRLCKELLIAHYDEFQRDQYCFDRLVRMQHYGLPTRLLDISGNPLVALFFACSCAEEIMDVEGEVVIFKINSDKIKYYDSDTVSCLANLSNLNYVQKNSIDLSLDVIEFNKTAVATKLLHHIKSEKGYFEARILPDDLGSIVCVKAKQTNTRIKSQLGAFLLFGHEVTLPESGEEGIEIARVTINNKRQILSQLDSININATTVYPSIDQTTGHLRDRYLQRESL